MKLFNFSIICVFLVVVIFSGCQEPITKPSSPDTTSHYFNWTIDTIGVPGTFLRDVAVINENDIWAVGEIYTDEPDTFFHTPTTQYNAAHWNGIRWDLHKIGFFSFCDTNHLLLPYPAKTIYAFNDTDMVSGLNNQITFLNGTKRVKNVCLDVKVTNIWGHSIDNFWVAGSDGKIAHFDGTDFTIQFSVPDVPIYDLFGQGDDHVWAVTGWNHPPPISYLAEYTNGAWQTVYQVEGIGDSLGYWYYGCAIGDSLYLSSYGGIIKRSILTGEVNLIPTAVIEDEPWKLGRVRGTGPNDLMVQATDATLRHWNGASWQVAINLQSYYTSYMGNFKLTHDYFVGVGNMQSGGFVIKALR